MLVLFPERGKMKHWVAPAELGRGGSFVVVLVILF